MSDLEALKNGEIIDKDHYSLVIQQLEFLRYENFRPKMLYFIMKISSDITLVNPFHITGGITNLHILDNPMILTYTYDIQAIDNESTQVLLIPKKFRKYKHLYVVYYITIKYNRSATEKIISKIIEANDKVLCQIVIIICDHGKLPKCDVRNVKIYNEDSGAIDRSVRNIPYQDHILQLLLIWRFSDDIWLPIELITLIIEYLLGYPPDRLIRR